MSKTARIKTQNGNEYEITFDPSRANSKGEVEIICPICTPSRQPNHQKETKLSINIHKNTWRCNHCGEGGYVLDKNKKKRDEPVIKPIEVKLQRIDISESLINWFWNKRKINLQTLTEFDISLSNEKIKMNRYTPELEKFKGQWIDRRCINFKYFIDKQLINIKFRDQCKNFKMVSGATLVPFNFDSIKDAKQAIIVEGEIDAMSYHQVGYKAIISVPNGVTFSQEEKSHYEQTGNVKVLSNANLEYLDPVIKQMDHIEMFIIATDDDGPGIKLREELARRLGKERCCYICFSDYSDEDGKPINDPNELLVKLGPEILKDTINHTYSFPIEDVTTANQYLDVILEELKSGSNRGLSTGYKTLDAHFNWMRGWPIVLNGWPQMGKTSFALCLIVASSVLYKWKWGIYCPENYPVKNVVEIITSVLTNKTFERGFKNTINEDEITMAVKSFVNKYFFFVDSKEDEVEKLYTPKELREIKVRLVKEKGIVGFLTDPWLSLNHKYRDLDQYLNIELNQEVMIAAKYNLINFICHHPKTPKDEKEIEKMPLTFKLTGGKLWWVKMYATLILHKINPTNYNDTRVGFHVEKIKDRKRAGEPTSPNNFPIFEFDKLTNRYYEENQDTKKCNVFPFKSYIEIKEQELFEGF